VTGRAWMGHQWAAMKVLLLTYRWSEGETLFYKCRVHGIVVLRPDGRVRVDDPDDPAARH
jgi:hypothetical protein